MRIAFFLPLVAIFSAMAAAPEDVGSHPATVADHALFSALDLDHNGLEAVREAVQRGNYAAAGVAWAEYFRARETPTAHFSREAWPDFVRAHFPQLVKPMIAEADKVVRREIGHPPFSLPVENGEIQWLHNPTKDTNYVSVVGSQWLLNPLGRAYLLTGDEQYAEAFAWFFESWYDHQEDIIGFQGNLGFDPIYRAYYPGIRIRILADDYYSMAQSLTLTPEFHVKIMKQLLGSASWLYGQEQHYRAGNQQVAAVVGLGVVGIMFPEFRDAEKWVACAEARMTEHLERDFFVDGGHKELCTQYHKTCLRDIGYVALTAEANGRTSLFETARPRLEAAYDWLAKIVMPTGETPALHSAAFSTDWAVHSLIAARYLERPDLLWLADRFWDRGIAPSQKAPFAFASYMVTEHLAPDAGALLAPTPPDYESVNLEASGFAVMRTGWDPQDRYLVFQYGWPESGHAYPGTLSFCLELNGELVATHPGSPRSYRHPAYAYCNSTRAHNVVSIDLADHARQNGVSPGGTLEAYADLPGAWYVKGRHEGYMEAFGATCERRILVVKDGPIWVYDAIVGAEGHTAHWNFHTPLEATVNPDRTVTLVGDRTYKLVPAFPDEIASVATERHWMAVLPEDCQPADCGEEVSVLRCEKPIGADGVKYCVALTKGDGAHEALGPGTFRLASGDRTYLLILNGSASTLTGRIETNAECLCVRFEDDAVERVWVFNGSRVVIMGVTWLVSNQTENAELSAPRADN